MIKARFWTLAVGNLSLAGVLALVSAASAADLDFNVASGNFLTTGNWVDADTNVPAAAAPTIGDRAFIRNNGTVTINSDVAVSEIRVGHPKTITNPDYNNNGVVDAADYVQWRNGGPLANDATPADVGPEDYTYWRSRFGGTPLVQQIGQPGTLLWTGGEITGPGGSLHSGGPQLRVGRVATTNGILYDLGGTVVQSGTSKILLSTPDGKLTIGDDNSTNTPTSSYTFNAGTIGLAIGGNGVQGANTDDGINVRNGAFTMNGGQIIDATPTDFTGLSAQRFLSVASDNPPSGSPPGSLTVATATLSGGTINVLGGIRVATDSDTRGTLNINGPIDIKTGGDTSIGYGASNGIGYMTMSAGTFQVGRTDIPNPLLPQVQLLGRLAIGDRGLGFLDMSGGTIKVTRNLRVANNDAAGGSVLTMTGGTIETPGLEMRVNTPTGIDAGASIILDGPNAVFTQTGVTLTTPPGTDNSIIGERGKALFEVRQGTATLGGNGTTINTGLFPASKATINVKGGKLILRGKLDRSDLTATPAVVGLTGGTLEFDQATGAQLFYADLKNAGTKLVTKLNTRQLVQVGSQSPLVPAIFEMTSGSWDLDISAHNVLTGADSFNVPTGTALLAGGTLNINYLSGFTPNPNEEFRIVRASGGTTLTSGAVTITWAGAGSWSLIEVPIVTVGFPLDEEIRLKYSAAAFGDVLGSSAIPEPSSVALLVFAVVGMSNTRRARYRSHV